MRISSQGPFSSCLLNPLVLSGLLGLVHLAAPQWVYLTGPLNILIWLYAGIAFARRPAAWRFSPLALFPQGGFVAVSAYVTYALAAWASEWIRGTAPALSGPAIIIGCAEAFVVGGLGALLASLIADLRARSAASNTPSGASSARRRFPVLAIVLAAAALAGSFFLGTRYGSAPVSPSVPRVPGPTPTRTARPAASRTPPPAPTRTPAKTPVPASAILYREDFESDSVADWTEYVGDWQLVRESGNQFWRGTGPNDYPQAWLNTEAYGSGEWDDYVFQARIRFQEGGLFLCVRADEGSSFYNAFLNSAEDAVIFADYGGGQYNTFGGRSFTIQTGQWYTVQFWVDGDRLSLYINDRLASRETRTSHARGSIGFYMGGGDTIDFDDLLVWQLSG